MKRKYSAKDLDRKVEISPPTKTTSSLKYEDVTFDSYVEEYAKILELPSSKEAEVKGGILYDEVLSVVIRYKSKYDTTDIQLKYKGKEYDVLSSREVYGRRQWLILKCKRGGKVKT